MHQTTASRDVKKTCMYTSIEVYPSSPGRLGAEMVMERRHGPENVDVFGFFHGHDVNSTLHLCWSFRRAHLWCVRAKRRTTYFQATKWNERLKHNTSADSSRLSMPPPQQQQQQHQPWQQQRQQQQQKGDSKARPQNHHTGLRRILCLDQAGNSLLRKACSYTLFWTRGRLGKARTAVPARGRRERCRRKMAQGHWCSPPAAAAPAAPTSPAPAPAPVPEKEIKTRAGNKRVGGKRRRDASTTR